MNLFEQQVKLEQQAKQIAPVIPLPTSLMRQHLALQGKIIVARPTTPPEAA